MPVSSTLSSDVPAAAWPRIEVADAMSIADIGGALGISDVGVVALASAGLLNAGAPGSFDRRSVDDLAEREWRLNMNRRATVAG